MGDEGGNGLLLLLRGVPIIEWDRGCGDRDREGNRRPVGVGILPVE
jgi:hypothetical protein